MTTPLISIVVPVFDGEDLIGDCIESLLAMDYPEDRREIIVVDNKSDDRTAEIIGRYPVIGGLERKPGAAAARNAGIAMARGEIIAFTDHDCVAGSAWASEIERSFANSTTLAVQGFAEGINDNLFAEVAQRRWEDWWFESTSVGLKLKRNGVDTRNCAIRKCAFDRCGHFNVDYLHCEDITMGMQLTAADITVVGNPEMRVAHRNLTSLTVALAKSRTRTPYVIRLIRDPPPGMVRDALALPRSAFFGLAERELGGASGAAVLSVARLCRRLTLGAFRLCLAVRLRHRLTVKLYKIYYGISYDLAIVESRRNQ